MVQSGHGTLQFSGGGLTIKGSRMSGSLLPASEVASSDRAPEVFGVSESVLGHLICIRMKYIKPPYEEDGDHLLVFTRGLRLESNMQPIQGFVSVSYQSIS